MSGTGRLSDKELPCGGKRDSRGGGIGDLYGSYANNSEWIIFCQKGKREFQQTTLLLNRKAGQKTKNKKISVPDKVTLGGKTYKVTSIDASAFKNNTSITEATIGKNVETIGKNAFTGCKKLKKVTIKSAQLKKIGSKAFNGCKSLKTITINSKKLTKIEN